MGSFLVSFRLMMEGDIEWEICNDGYFEGVSWELRRKTRQEKYSNHSLKLGKWLQDLRISSVILQEAPFQ